MNNNNDEFISILKEINSSLKIISLVAIKESGISKDTFKAIEKNKPFYLKVWELLKWVDAMKYTNWN